MIDAAIFHWPFEAKKRCGFCVLDYVVTSNHVHLLVKDTGGEIVAQSMQLIAGRTAQEYNQRDNRQGAFWEDRYMPPPSKPTSTYIIVSSRST